MDRPPTPSLTRYRALLAEVLGTRLIDIAEDERIPMIVDQALAALVIEDAHRPPGRRSRVPMADCVQALRWRFGLVEAQRPLLSYREIGIEMGLSLNQAQGRVGKGLSRLWRILSANPVVLAAVSDPQCQLDQGQQCGPLADLIQLILALPADRQPAAIAACHRLVTSTFTT
ncbi:MAG: hypothetical protein KKB13_18230 [Chloroflexi bacterium]|nr:hypothetical protein [Chloroflexota bacterium]